MGSPSFDVPSGRTSVPRGQSAGCRANAELPKPLLHEPHRFEVEFVRLEHLEYNVQTTAAAIRASELPDEFAVDIETAGVLLKS
jgi:hypothetical protein